MKKFRYRLERVKQYRERLRDEKKGALLRANQALRAAQDKLAALKQAQSENLVPEGPVEAAKMFLVGMYAARLKQEIEWQLVNIKECELAVEKALAEYIEASKDARALELHKQKKEREYQEFVDKEIDKANDEMSLLRRSYDKGSAEGL